MPSATGIRPPASQFRGRNEVDPYQKVTPQSANADSLPGRAVRFAHKAARSPPSQPSTGWSGSPMATGFEPLNKGSRTLHDLLPGTDPAARLIPFQASTGCLKLLRNRYSPPHPSFLPSVETPPSPPASRGRRKGARANLEPETTFKRGRRASVLQDISAVIIELKAGRRHSLSAFPNTRGKNKIFLPCKKKNKAMDNIQAR